MQSTTITVLPSRFGLIMLAHPACCWNLNNWTDLTVWRQSWPQPSKKDLWRLTTGNSQLFPPLGICIWQMQPEKEVVSILSTQCSGDTKLVTSVLIPRSIPIATTLVIAKDINILEPIWQRDPQQQQQQQLRSWQYHWLQQHPLHQPLPKSTHIIGTSRCAWFIAMAETEQHDSVALVSVENWVLLGELLNVMAAGLGFEATQDRLTLCQDVLLQVAR